MLPSLYITCAHPGLTRFVEKLKKLIGAFTVAFIFWLPLISPLERQARDGNKNIEKREERNKAGRAQKINRA